MGGIGDISFLWPRLLWLLTALPLLVALYLWLGKRRRRAAAALPSLELAGTISLRGAAVRHWVPALLWLLALAALLLSTARPQATITLPARLETIILALDASGSMRATDLAPDRITAARNAAKTFVDAQPRDVKIGVVAIAAAAAVVQSPTTKREDIKQALDRLEPQRGTALGNGLMIALDTALPQANINVEDFINPRRGQAPAGRETRKGGEKVEPRPDATGTVAIILLSDGQSNVGADPLKAAEIAADYGVRIYTVGIGTTDGVVVSADGWSMRTRLDEEALKKIAALTQGEYFQAANAAELKKIYQTLSTRLGFVRQQPTEVTALFVAFGALLATLAALLSMSWFNRIL
jgi:Ca-activated chloride channel family protein